MIKVGLGTCTGGPPEAFDLMLPETSDGAILFVFGDEAAVAASKAAEAAETPTPAPELEAEPEAAYEAARAEKVQEGAAANGVIYSQLQQCPSLDICKDTGC